MQLIPPRLSSLMGILAGAASPVSVDSLAESLGSSRRTVFRELQNADALLAPYGLQLTTVVGEGLVLHGPKQGKASLVAALQSAPPPALHSKEDRRALLAVLLLDSGEMQKLFAFAKALGVSEATVSTDLDALEPRFAAFRLRLRRKPGVGVEVLGREDAKRSALCALLADEADDGFSTLTARCGTPARGVAEGIDAMLAGPLAADLAWMTGDSFEMLRIYLVVLADRVGKGQLSPAASTPATGLAKHLAGAVATALEEQFTLALPACEQDAIALVLRAARAKSAKGIEALEGKSYNRVQSIAYRMIDAFDPALAHQLKLDETLVQGLSVHLFSAIVRLENNLTLTAPVQRQLQEGYPELFEKSRRAAKVLQEEFGTPVPDGETAFLASHFGAAALHLQTGSHRRRVLRAGLVCVAGVGVSYMLASQVRGAFAHEVEVDIFDWAGEAEWENADFLISTIELSYDARPVILVQPVLTAGDMDAIRTVVDALAIDSGHAAESPDFGPLLESLDTVSGVLQGAASVLRSFNTVPIHASASFDELAKLAGYRFGTQAESGGDIYTALTRREAVSTQVIPQLEIVLLHAKTAGVKQPMVGIITPEGGRFTHSHFQNARGCLVLLVPKAAPRPVTELMGCISGALVEDDALLAAVQTGNGALAFVRVQAALGRHIKQVCSQHFL